MQAVNTISFWSLVLTSAAVAAIVSSVATLLGQKLERRGRRRELLFEKAFELARGLRARAEKRAAASVQKVAVQDDLVSAETYYKWLQVLWDTGSLPDDPRIKRIVYEGRDELDGEQETPPTK